MTEPGNPASRTIELMGVPPTISRGDRIDSPAAL
jgi:hypothetical protein